MNLSTRILRPAAAILALGALGVGVAACGGTSDTTTPAATTPAATTPAATTPAATTPAATSTSAPATAVVVTTVPVVLGKPKEFSLVPGSAEAPAGKITFKVKNDGVMVHEVVVIKTSLDAGKLPLKNGEAGEKGSLGETGEMEAGTTRGMTLTLTPGHYALICNLPGHYVGGMWANFTVK